MEITLISSVVVFKSLNGGFKGHSCGVQMVRCPLKARHEVTRSVGVRLKALLFKKYIKYN
jgi:hypothetical protein